MRSNVCSKSGQRRRRLCNVESAFGRCLVFAWQWSFDVGPPFAMRSCIDPASYVGPIFGSVEITGVSVWGAITIMTSPRLYPSWSDTRLLICNKKRDIKNPPYHILCTFFACRDWNEVHYKNSSIQHYTQSQKTVTAYFSSKQLLPFDFGSLWWPLF